MGSRVVNMSWLLFYTAAVVGCAMGEWATAGKYRLALMVGAMILGFAIGFGAERRICPGSPAPSPTQRIIAAVLFVLPLAFCDSLLLLLRYRSVSGILPAAVNMIFIQLGILVYVWVRALRADE